MRLVLAILLAASTILVSSCNEHKAALSDTERLIGTWDLIEWSGTKEDGKVIHPFGKTAIGMLIYTPEGTAVLSLSKDDRPILGSDDYKTMSRDTLLEAYSGFFSYHGSYEVIESEQKVIHKVEACKIPDWKGREQTRLYSFEHDTLVLRADKVIGLQHELRWIRRSK